MNIELVKEIKHTLNHARVFIASKQKMYKSGIKEYDTITDQVTALHDSMLKQCKNNHKLFNDKDDICNICGKPLNPDF